MASALLDMLEQETAQYTPLYPDDLDLKAKIETVVREIYRGEGMKLSAKAAAQIEELERQGFGQLPVCMAKTPYSFSDQANLLGAPEGFTVQVKDVTLSAGAGFVVVHTGKIVTMPGLPKHPAAERIHLDERGQVAGLL